ncbi:MAG: DegT/DnrJ/EryC1/StrS family aminotransferase [Calditrichaceae bacterium]|nr:DegT/DnrJ/EryC1/StrS family aminotransferase [Calditrichaceae bacterium]MBN2708862.1 DegT/DnrJ/EryC1/StrS family aminotransferase [Calditrichaceae bacterium]RQV97612.1 MAG: DegT/DnrJ/EryC1/StrS family aminotransferase [Calditrichota bacterium]
MAGIELFGQEEKKEVLDVLETGILFRYNHPKERMGHWKARQFEQELREFTNSKYCHMCSSGSTAIQLALSSAGVGAGDHVIVPPFTFIATIEAVINLGAIPVFAEMDETLCISPEGLRKAITPKTTAVALVHMLGSMAHLDEITKICRENNIMLIEDTAQALGGTYKGKSLGTFGITGSFSFDFFKIITAGEGGAVITDDKEVYENLHQGADHGHNHQGDNRGAEPHPIIGFNYRISELNAAVGLAQFRKIEFILAEQRKHKAMLKEAVAAFPQVKMRDLPDPEGDSATFLAFFLPDEVTARKVYQEFNKREVAGASYWYDNNFHYIKNWQHIKELRAPGKLAIEFFERPQDYRTMQLPESDHVMQRLVTLPIKVNWPQNEMETYIKNVKNALKAVLG